MISPYRRWRALWNPDMYHGWGKPRNFFEGWYFKLVDPEEQFAFAVIPGISRDREGNTHAFIQLLDGKMNKASYYPFPAESFLPSPGNFEITIGNHFFSAARMKIDLPELSGELVFKDPYPWPKQLGAPGIMGWYSFVPFMECYHGVVSMDHQLEGRLRVHGREISFTGGKGYIEKDWGKSFPHSWIWTQTNHFDTPQRASLFASVARIPWLGSSFTGFIVGFLLDNRLYRFATYTGAQMKASLGEHTVHLHFRDKRNRLEIIAHQMETTPLVSPIAGAMTGKVNDSMQARVELRLYTADSLIFQATGRNAGLEVAGTAHALLSAQWRR